MGTAFSYEIDTNGASWADAEKQVKASLEKKNDATTDKAPTVSVKSSKQPKRKVGETAREIYDKEIGSKEQKKIKRGTEGKQSSSKKKKH